ncbi:unnamed protein product [Sphagnum jensenii]|uniref:Uncharacterized protein n=2 Tax=Sphagnum jensenii TaxID=128206 RepID=A0ABP1BBH8_9BRYO
MLRSVVRRGLHSALSESILSARILKENAAPAVIAEFQGVRSYLGWNNLQGFVGQLPTKKNGGEEELLLASRLSGSGGSSALNSGGWNTCGGVCGFGESAALHAQFQCLNECLLQQRRTFVQMRTSLEVADNSGARRVSCIKVLGGAKTGKLGDLIIASVKDALPRGKVKKGEVVNCVIVRAAMQRQRSDGSEIRFDKNAVVIVNKQGEPIGTRIFGPVPHELRMRKFMKILTLADHVT